MVEELEHLEMLPAIVFIFSRAACDDAVHQVVRDLEDNAPLAEDVRRLRDEHQREKQQGQGGDDRDTSHRALSFCYKVWIAGGHERARSRGNCQSEPESGSVAVWIDRYFGRARLQGLPYLSG